MQKQKLIIVFILPSLELFISNCRHGINHLDFSTFSPTHSNLTPSERTALHSLSNNPNIVIIPTDKRDAVLVWQADLYRTEARCQLLDTTSQINTRQSSTSQTHHLWLSSPLHSLQPVLIPAPALPASNSFPIHKWDCPG